MLIDWEKHTDGREWREQKLPTFSPHIANSKSFWPVTFAGEPVLGPHNLKRRSHRRDGLTYKQAQDMAHHMSQEGVGPNFVAYCPRPDHNAVVMDLDTAKAIARVDNKDALKGIMEGHERMLKDFAHTYTEISQSGISTHCIALLPKDHGLDSRRKNDKLFVEQYVHGQYIILTGDCTTTQEIKPIADGVLEKLKNYFPPVDRAASGPLEAGNGKPMFSDDLRNRIRNTSELYANYLDGEKTELLLNHVRDSDGKHFGASDHLANFMQIMATYTDGCSNQRAVMEDVLFDSWFAKTYTPYLSGSPNPDRFTNKKQIDGILTKQFDKAIRWGREKAEEMRSMAEAGRAAFEGNLLAYKDNSKKPTDSESPLPPAPVIEPPPPLSAVSSTLPPKPKSNPMPLPAPVPNTALHQMVYKMCKAAINAPDAEATLRMTTHLVVGTIVGAIFDLEGSATTPHIIHGAGSGAGKAFPAAIMRHLFNSVNVRKNIQDDAFVVLQRFVTFDKIKSAEGLRDGCSSKQFPIFVLEEAEAHIKSLDPNAVKTKYQGLDEYYNGLCDGKSTNDPAGAKDASKKPDEDDTPKTVLRPRGSTYLATQIDDLAAVLSEKIFSKGAGGRSLFVVARDRSKYERDAYLKKTKLVVPPELRDLIRYACYQMSRHSGAIVHDDDDLTQKAKLEVFDKNENLPRAAKRMLPRATELVLRFATHHAVAKRILGHLTTVDQLQAQYEGNGVQLNLMPLMSEIPTITLDPDDYAHGVAIVNGSYDAVKYMATVKGLGDQSHAERQRILIDAFRRAVKTRIKGGHSTLTKSYIVQRCNRWDGPGLHYAIEDYLKELSADGYLVPKEKGKKSLVMTDRLQERLDEEYENATQIEPD